MIPRGRRPTLATAGMEEEDEEEEVAPNSYHRTTTTIHRHRHHFCLHGAAAAMWEGPGLNLNHPPRHPSSSVLVLVV